MILRKLVLFVHILQEICANQYMNSCHKHVAVVIPKSADCSILIFCEKKMMRSWISLVITEDSQYFLLLYGR